MSKTVEEILAPKPEVRPRIYAYSIADEAHKGLLKVGQTTRDVKQRIAEQVKTAAIKNYKIELNESAERDDGGIAAQARSMACRCLAQGLDRLGRIRLPPGHESTTGPFLLTGRK